MGRSRGEPTTKIDALVDAEGRPVRLALTAGQAGDAPAAEDLAGEAGSPQMKQAVVIAGAQSLEHYCMPYGGP